MENEKLIAALRETQSLGDAPVGLFWGVIVTKELVKECIDALERLTAESAEKDAEIERLKEQIAADSQLKSGLDNANALCRTYKADRDRLQAELDAAVEDMNHIAREIEKCDWTLAKDGEKVGSLHLGRCAVCNHRYCDEEILDGCHFEWRGKEHG